MGRPRNAVEGGEANLSGYRRVTIDVDGVPTRMYAHRAVLYLKIGGGWHECHWCGKEISWELPREDPQALVADHVDFDRTNNTRDNLVESCIACNIYRTERRFGEASEQEGEE